MPLSVEELLRHSADPLAILNEAGSVVWSNQAFDTLLSKSGAQQVFPAGFSEQLAQITHFAEISLTINSSGRPLPQTALIIDISAGDPDSALYLVTLKSASSEESKIQAREEHLAAVAHDLRNPIGAIFSYADALIDTTAGEGLKPSQREILRRIRSTASRSVELILNYQLLSQIQSKGFLKPHSPVDLNGVVRNVIDTIWREENSASITCNICESPLSVFMERVHLERALSNLVANALKYTPPTGTIIVTTSATKKGPAVSVLNTGTAIPAAELGTIFDRYQRASSSKGIGGSGLGLFIVKTIMELYGGSVAVTSNPNEGVTFILNFA